MMTNKRPSLSDLTTFKSHSVIKDLFKVYQELDYQNLHWSCYD